MATLTEDIAVYVRQGALLTVGNNRVVSFTNFQNPITREIVVNDGNNDSEWDLGETATFGGQAATFVGTGTATVGVTVDLPFPLADLTVTLSDPVRIAVFNVGGTQYLRLYNADGSEASPAALLNGLATKLVSSLGGLTGIPIVNTILGNPLAYVQTNAVLTFNLGTGGFLIPCFTAGTLIATAGGEVPVETLSVGDLVLTVDHGLQPIRWIGSRTLTAAELDRAPHLRPIRISRGALGSDLPSACLTVSPQHRCLVRSPIAERMAGEREVLVAAKHLLGAEGIEVVEAAEPVTYIHLLFDRHELLWSNGAVTESFYLGEQAVAAVDQAARKELLELFPELAQSRRPAPARTFLRGHLARKLVERTTANRKVLVETGREKARQPSLANS